MCSSHTAAIARSSTMHPSEVDGDVRTAWPVEHVFGQGFFTAVWRAEAGLDRKRRASDLCNGSMQTSTDALTKWVGHGRQKTRGGADPDLAPPARPPDRDQGSPRDGAPGGRKRRRWDQR